MNSSKERLRAMIEESVMIFGQIPEYKRVFDSDYKNCENDSVAQTEAKGMLETKLARRCVDKSAKKEKDTNSDRLIDSLSSRSIDPPHNG